jgi:hypothetical protein
MRPGAEGAQEQVSQFRLNRLNVRIVVVPAVVGRPPGGVTCLVRRTRSSPHSRRQFVIVLGIILILVGYLLPVPSIIVTIGWILLVVGLILTILGAVGRGVGGRKTYF